MNLGTVPETSVCHAIFVLNYEHAEWICSAGTSFSLQKNGNNGSSSENLPKGAERCDEEIIVEHVLFVSLGGFAAQSSKISEIQSTTIIGTDHPDSLYLIHFDNSQG